MRTMTRKAISQLCIGLVGLPLVPAGMALNARAATIYNEKHKPLPCNDLCRAWLGSHYVEVEQGRLSRCLPQQTPTPDI